MKKQDPGVHLSVGRGEHGDLDDLDESQRRQRSRAVVYAVATEGSTKWILLT